MSPGFGGGVHPAGAPGVGPAKGCPAGAPNCGVGAPYGGAGAPNGAVGAPTGGGATGGTGEAAGGTGGVVGSGGDWGAPGACHGLLSVTDHLPPFTVGSQSRGAS